MRRSQFITAPLPSHLKIRWEPNFTLVLLRIGTLLHWSAEVPTGGAEPSTGNGQLLRTIGLSNEASASQRGHNKRDPIPAIQVTIREMVSMLCFDARVQSGTL